MSQAAAAPQRTCVGCRARATTADLLRVVVVDGRAVPDPRRRLPGRGANLHPDPECLRLAARRRALPRALRVTGPLDAVEVETWLAAAGPSTTGDTQHHRRHDVAGPRDRQDETAMSPR